MTWNKFQQFIMKLFVRLSPDMRYEEILKAEMEDGGGGWVGGWVGGWNFNPP